LDLNKRFYKKKYRRIIFFSKLQNGGLNGDGVINHCFLLKAFTQLFLNRIQDRRTHFELIVGPNFLFKMESKFKMAILRFPISPSEPCIFAIFKPTNFIFWILIENYTTTNDISGFFDYLSISSGIELQ
jgi:hypothetical protein